MQITEENVFSLTQAIFTEQPLQVVEAYSEIDCEPMSFQSAYALQAYIQAKLTNPKSHVHLFVVYSDMGGKAERKTIQLNPLKVKTGKVRFTWEGWGFISIVLAHPTASIASHISANSEQRALNWAATNPAMDAPSTWNWAAVKKHQNRLNRVLKKCSNLLAG